MKIEGQVNKQPTIRNLAKLLMNSMYGRFGMHTDAIRHDFLTTTQVLDYAKNYELINVTPLGALQLVSYTLSNTSIQLGNKTSTPTIRRFMEGLIGNTNVAIASAITSYSRMIINQYKLDALKLGLSLYYSDTDSLVLDGPLPSKYLDDAKLGMLKLEHIFKEGIFVMPKVYYLELEDGSSVSKCKGYSGKLSRQQYLDLLNGTTLNLEVKRWSRSLTNSSIQICSGIPYHINFTFNKRDLRIKDGKWVDTKPIIFMEHR
jgi:DNA polymerase elongation subunit (family B)